jgi:hypothetical protein
MCWHELGGSANITSHINNYRDLESSLGISELPISINEYCHPTHEYEGCPGTSAPFIAKFERNKIHSASISWWFTNLPGRLGSLLTASNEKGGGWWFYKWYGDMTGNMVRVTPPNDYSDGIDGFACLDTNAQYASICLGGDDSGTFDVEIDGIPSSFGDTVYVKVEYVPWVSKDTSVSGPVLVSNTAYGVTDGTITVPVDVTSSLYGYRVYVSSENTITFVDNETKTVPSVFELSQNYPNPFNPITNIEYSVPVSDRVSLKVYNNLGQVVATLFEGHQKAGTYVTKFDASGLASGVYIYRLESSNAFLAKKLILMK